MAASRYGTSSEAMGTASACPPLVVSRAYERQTLMSRRGRSTSVFRNPSSSPLRSPE
ncbi:MAG: hypothetical protein WBP56_07260 [Polyangia bacterium]